MYCAAVSLHSIKFSFTSFRARTMQIEIDDLTRPEVHALLHEHLANMHELSPADKVFALDLSKLRVPEITFWTVWDGDLLLGCGALKALSTTHGEIKSMRTPAAHRGRGAGRAVLERIIETARQRGYQLLSLETGSHPAFGVAQQLYRSAGFEYSGPFADYKEDPHSVFMDLRLTERVD
jgi:putative acetyltransferase